MREGQHLRIPGPTDVPPSVLRAMSRPMMNHRGPEFAALSSSVNAGLKSILGSNEMDVLTLTCSGTGVMEAAVSNLISPGDKVLVASSGVFGERFAEILKAYGAIVDLISSTPGEPVSPKEVAKKIEADNKLDYKAVFATHNETSTGVTNDIKSMASVLEDHPALFVVDAVSSFGAIELDPAWGIDVVLSGSQKALMCPPGLGVIALNKDAWARVESSKSPRFYFDLRSWRKYAEKGQTPVTPAVSVMYALDEALRLINEEGIKNVFARHKRIGSMARDGVKSLGLELFAKKGASDIVTAVNVPYSVDVKQLLSISREKYNVIFAGGQKDLAGKIFRIGHVGHVSDEDILLALSVLENSLSECGFVK